MPQSWPSSWVLLFILFILTYLLVNTMVYFMIKPAVSLKTTGLSSIKKHHLIWSW